MGIVALGEDKDVEISTIEDLMYLFIKKVDNAKGSSKVKGHLNEDIAKKLEEKKTEEEEKKEKEISINLDSSDEESSDTSGGDALPSDADEEAIYDELKSRSGSNNRSHRDSQAQSQAGETPIGSSRISQHEAPIKGKSGQNSRKMSRRRERNGVIDAAIIDKFMVF